MSIIKSVGWGKIWTAVFFDVFGVRSTCGAAVVASRFVSHLLEAGVGKRRSAQGAARLLLHMNLPQRDVNTHLHGDRPLHRRVSHWTVLFLVTFDCIGFIYLLKVHLRAGHRCYCRAFCLLITLKIEAG